MNINDMIKDTRYCHLNSIINKQIHVIISIINKYMLVQTVKGSDCRITSAGFGGKKLSRRRIFVTLFRRFKHLLHFISSNKLMGKYIHAR